MIKNVVKKAFTLAEIMIVFTVIGILTAILVPTLLISAPDQDKLKAKKAYHTITRAVSELLNSGVYSEYDGTLVSTPFIKGTSDDDAKARVQFFCNQLADHLNVSYSNCNEDFIKDNLTFAIADYCSDFGSFTHPDKQTSGFCSMYADDAKKMNYSSLVGTSESPNFSDAFKTKEKYFNTHLKNTTSDNDRKTKFNFITQDGVRWVMLHTNFTHDSSYTHDGITEPLFYAPIYFSTDKGKSLENIYGLVLRKDGKIIPDYHLQKILDEIEEDN